MTGEPDSFVSAIRRAIAQVLGTRTSVAPVSAGSRDEGDEEGATVPPVSVPLSTDVLPGAGWPPTSMRTSFAVWRKEGFGPGNGLQLWAPRGAYQFESPKGFLHTHPNWSFDSEVEARRAVSRWARALAAGPYVQGRALFAATTEDRVTGWVLTPRFTPLDEQIAAALVDVNQPLNAVLGAVAHALSKLDREVPIGLQAVTLNAADLEILALPFEESRGLLSVEAVCDRVRGLLEVAVAGIGDLAPRLKKAATRGPTNPREQELYQSFFPAV